ncbi:hypothetical protein ACIQF5_20575 [Streptomyces goshikiensis]|uniref:hypothetical protein n=1 Tax=Streptomyces goshikiensis TaxID=1942 RepID=UPI0037F49D28
MTRSKHAHRTMAHEGLNPAPSTLRKWLDGTQTPREDDLVLIEATYRRMRRNRIARYLLQRLNANGGTLIEIHPAEDGNVPQQNRRRHKSVRKVKIRRWTRS